MDAAVLLKAEMEGIWTVALNCCVVQVRLEIRITHDKEKHCRAHCFTRMRSWVQSLTSPLALYK